MSFKGSECQKPELGVEYVIIKCNFKDDHEACAGCIGFFIDESNGSFGFAGNKKETCTICGGYRARNKRMGCFDVGSLIYEYCVFEEYSSKITGVLSIVGEI